jgi:PspA-Associated protein
VIVRIFSDGQYRIPTEVEERLHELDSKTVEAIDAGDEPAFTESYGALVELIHASGERLADDELEPSDLMLPPADITLAEAREEFTGEGLIPEG